LAILQRRIFYGKVGKGAELTEHVKRVNDIMTKHGIDQPIRVLSDFNSGRTDRIVVELRYESLTEMEATERRMFGEPNSQKDFDDYVVDLSELIHHSEVEHWQLHS
jgi:hypothetical protein|tara:strand:+ start:772 stop:1089 length:318 start_codon:yes stop_codon:yes gene_type:complete